MSNTNTNTNTVDAYERAGTINNTRYATRTSARVAPKRFADEAIVRDAATLLRTSIADHGAPMGWVETLRTLRWSGLARCDQRRFRGIDRDGNATLRNLYGDALALAQSRRKIK